MKPALTSFLAHNPGGTPALPMIVLMLLPIPFLIAAIYCIAKKRYLLALFAILATAAAGFTSFMLLVNSIV